MVSGFITAIVVTEILITSIKGTSHNSGRCMIKATSSAKGWLLLALPSSENGLKSQSKLSSIKLSRNVMAIEISTLRTIRNNSDRLVAVAILERTELEERCTPVIQ